MGRKVVDAFMFQNELKLLEQRLAVLNEHVDHFVIVEATHTFSGRSKETHFEKIHKLVSAEILKKIVQVLVTDMPNQGNAWANESWQRNCIARGLKVLSLAEDDLVYISDLDEIPDLKILDAFKTVGLTECVGLHMKSQQYSLRQFCEMVHKAKLVSQKVLRDQFGLLPDKARYHTGLKVPNAGWHLDQFMDAASIHQKLKDFAHQEFNNDKFNTSLRIEDCLKTGKHLFVEGRQLTSECPRKLKDKPPRMELLMKLFPEGCGCCWD